MTTAAPPEAIPDRIDGFAQAVAQQEAGRFDEAVTLLHQVLATQPDHTEALSRLGWLLAQTGQLGLAVDAQRRITDIQPQSASAWSNLGVTLQTLGQHEEALRVLLHAVSLDPQIAEIQMNLGIEWQAHGMPSRAVTCYRQAIARKPELAEAWINLANALQDMGETTLALTANRQALVLQPGNWQALSNRQMGCQYSPTLSLEEIRHEAAQAGRRFPACAPQTLTHGSPPQAPRLRIGYVSGDLYAHPVGWMFARVAAAHDRTVVEVHCYADQRTQDFLTDELRDSVEHWHPVQNQSHEALRTLIQSHHIDVLIDLCGHTASNRLPVFAQRAAPVQLGWLGFSASTGIPAMDGIILGRATAPPGAETAFTEKVWRLPCSQFSYRPPDYAPEVMPPPHTRNGHITFGCFNNPAKIGHEVVALWATILHANPNSRLLLKSRSLADPHIAERMRYRFAVQGIDPARLDVRGASPHPEMLAQYGDMDIALDPFPFCGGLTTCEALWMGVPVVTLAWLRPMSRQGQDLLQEVGLHALVARTPRGYASIAHQLAADSTRLQHLRHSLRARMRQSDLCDGLVLSRALEAVYIKAAGSTGVSPP